MPDAWFYKFISVIQIRSVQDILSLRLFSKLQLPIAILLAVVASNRHLDLVLAPVKLSHAVNNKVLISVIGFKSQMFVSFNRR